MPRPAAPAADARYALRDATLDDLEAIVEIYNATIPSRMVTADLEPVSVESRHQWFEAHDSLRRPLWILEDDSSAERTPLGWLSLADFYGRPAYAASAEVSIYLANHVQGLGLGRLMLSRAVDFAPSAGITALLGFIFGHNQRSLELFRRSQFETWGLLPRVASLDGQERDLVIVGRRL